MLASGILVRPHESQAYPYDRLDRRRAAPSFEPSFLTLFLEVQSRLCQVLGKSFINEEEEE